MCITRTNMLRCKHRALCSEPALFLFLCFPVAMATRKFSPAWGSSWPSTSSWTGATATSPCSSRPGGRSSPDRTSPSQVGGLQVWLSAAGPGPARGALRPRSWWNLLRSANSFQHRTTAAKPGAEPLDQNQFEN